MTDPVMSPTTFKWVLTVLTALGCFWVLQDIRYMIRDRNADQSVPENRDKRFAYYIGILIGAGVIYGLLQYHGVVPSIDPHLGP
ncbi:MAG TPA: hypothetical protein VGM39_08345 [Kofleriaceae bacterium]